jgi:diazepam-binding inhibitor (GABA receptor modulating acyl-CoA-binding protein)
MSLTEEFQSATQQAKSLPEQSNDVLLKIYAWYKQATAGDVSGKRPGMLNPVGKAKFDAWAEHKGKSQVDAQTAYVALIGSLAGD